MTKPEFQHINTNMVGDVAVVEVTARELRFPPQARELGEELAVVAAQDWSARLLVNLGHVRYLSSTGFAILFNLVRQARENGRVVKFCALAPEVQIGAEIVGLDQIAEVYETERAALASFG